MPMQHKPMQWVNLTDPIQPYYHAYILIYRLCLHEIIIEAVTFYSIYLYLEIFYMYRLGKISYTGLTTKDETS